MNAPDAIAGSIKQACAFGDGCVACRCAGVCGEIVMTTPELLPCPFCGGEARLWPVIMPFDADCDAITVQCPECDAVGANVLVDQDVHDQSDLPSLEAEAIAAWNRRAGQSANAERVTAMEANNARLREALRWFLNDSRFVVQVGGNPNVVPAMIEAARAALGDAA